MPNVLIHQSSTLKKCQVKSTGAAVVQIEIERPPAPTENQTPRSRSSGGRDEYHPVLWETVSRYQRVQSATRVRANIITVVGAAGRTRRNAARRVQLDVGHEFGRIGDGSTGALALFQRELVGRRVNLSEVVDTGVGLRGGARLHEVGNRNRRQKANNGHDDHDFNQRETRLADVFGLFHLFYFLFVHAAEQRIRRVI